MAIIGKGEDNVRLVSARALDATSFIMYMGIAVLALIFMRLLAGPQRRRYLRLALRF